MLAKTTRDCGKLSVCYKSSLFGVNVETNFILNLGLTHL